MIYSVLLILAYIYGFHIAEISNLTLSVLFPLCHYYRRPDIAVKVHKHWSDLDDEEEKGNAEEENNASRLQAAAAATLTNGMRSIERPRLLMFETMGGGGGDQSGPSRSIMLLSPSGDTMNSRVVDHHDSVQTALRLAQSPAAAAALQDAHDGDNDHSAVESSLRSASGSNVSEFANFLIGRSIAEAVDARSSNAGAVYRSDTMWNGRAGGRSDDRIDSGVRMPDNSYMYRMNVRVPPSQNLDGDSDDDLEFVAQSRLINGSSRAAAEAMAALDEEDSGAHSSSSAAAAAGWMTTWLERQTAAAQQQQYLQQQVDDGSTMPHHSRSWQHKHDDEDDDDDALMVRALQNGTSLYATMRAADLLGSTAAAVDNGSRSSTRPGVMDFSTRASVRLPDHDPYRDDASQRAADDRDNSSKGDS
jgi:hypothetical protein